MHYDPATAAFLLNLFEKLSAMGYTRFFDEMQPTNTLDHTIQLYEVDNQLFQTYLQKGKDAKLDPRNPDDLFQLAGNNPKLFTGLFQIFYTIEAKKFLMPFMKKLKKLNFSYQGVDIAFKNPTELKDINKRDEVMIRHYLETSENVLGRIGMLHALGMQKRIANNLIDLPEKIAEASFCFVHLHSMPSVSDDEYKLKNEINYPLGMHNIHIDIDPEVDINVDISKKLQPAFEKIVTLISQKQKQLAELKKLTDTIQLPSASPLPANFFKPAYPERLEIIIDKNNKNTFLIPAEKQSELYRLRSTLGKNFITAHKENNHIIYTAPLSWIKQLAQHNETSLKELTKFTGISQNELRALLANEEKATSRPKRN